MCLLQIPAQVQSVGDERGHTLGRQSVAEFAAGNAHTGLRGDLLARGGDVRGEGGGRRAAANVDLLVHVREAGVDNHDDNLNETDTFTVISI
jgi:hypothetical protein